MTSRSPQRTWLWPPSLATFSTPGRESSQRRNSNRNPSLGRGRRYLNDEGGIKNLATIHVFCFLLQHFVPSESKDERYWQKRVKNNIAARRSREARRLKENQIALRAAFLEKENNTLRCQLVEMAEVAARVEAEKRMLQERLLSYEMQQQLKSGHQ